MVFQFLESLPQSFADTGDVQSATGAAMQVAHKLIVSLIIFFLCRLIFVIAHHYPRQVTAAHKNQAQLALHWALSKLS